MTDARDELRAAMGAQREEEATRDRHRGELARQAQQYEEEEQAVLAQLCETAEVMVEALSRSVPTEGLPIGPAPVGLGKLVRPQKRVDGWKISLGVGEDRVLCPDGALIAPKAFFDHLGPSYSTLREWLERRCGEVRASGLEEGRPTRWAEAFDPSSRPYGGDRGAAQAALRSRLADLKESVTKLFAGILHEHGASV